MKKFGTKFITAATVTAMALAFTPSVSLSAASPDVTAAPASGTTSGTGTMEGHAEKDVFCVVLPTIAESDDPTFNFILDPENLIKTTKDNSASKGTYTDKTFEEGANVFFANTASDKATDYSSKSDKLSVINKSTMDVDVTVDAEVKNYTGITLTDDNAFSDDTSTSLYLALLGGSADVGKIDPATGKMSLTSTVAKTDGAYELKYNTDKYEYVLKDSFTNEQFEKYEFQMTGKCNSDGDWSDLTTAAPTVDVVWTVDKHVDRYITETTITSADPVLHISLPSDVSISSVKFEDDTDLADFHTYNSEAGTISFVAEHIDMWKSAGHKFVFTYSNGKTEEVTIQ